MYVFGAYTFYGQSVSLLILALLLTKKVLLTVIVNSEMHSK